MARKLIVEIIGDASSLEKAFKKSAHGADQFNRDVSKMTRGVAAGTGVFRGLGRSIAFASGGFLAFAGVSKFLTDSVNAAREAGVAQRSLAAQMKASGESFQANREEVEKAALSFGKFGFQNDEVVAGLTILERGTGKVSESLKLLQLSADIARAKGTDLASSAQVVAKVFGGQETALRRAVPGLSKNAHGWDLIREAQRKMAGQAAANTTASERFAAVLHDTEEIIGGALLPTLNKFLTSLSKWLDRQNRSGNLQKRVNQIMEQTTQVFGRLKTIVEDVVGALGGWQNALIVLGGAWVGLKVQAIGATVAITTANIIAAGVVERAWQAALISTGWGALAIAAGVAATEIIFHWKRVKIFFQEFWLWMEETGLLAFRSIIELFSHLPRNLGKWARDEKNEVNKQLDAIYQKDVQLRTQLAKPLPAAKAPPGLAGPTPEFTPPGLEGPITGTAVKVAKRTAEQLNQWFDAMINRKLFRGGLLPLKQQLAVLDEVARLLTERIKKTKDVTRLLTLNDQLLQVRANRIQIQQDLAAQAEQAAQAARDEALAWADFAIERAAATKGLKDDLKAAQAKLKLLEKQAGAGKKSVEQARAIWEAQQEVNRIRKEMSRSDRGFATKFTPVSTRQILAAAGLDLSPDQIRRLRASLAQVGMGGTVPPGRTAAFAGAGAVVITGDVHVHGVQNPKEFETAMQKRAAARSHNRRGHR